MKISDIDAFFSELDRRIERPIQVLITGGAAAILFGGTRMTQDIDFEVKFKTGNKISADAWSRLQERLDQVSRSTGISSQYSDDIDRWSSILVPGKKSVLHKKIGKVEVRILDPGLWAIGKLSRYLNSDVADLVEVFSKLKPPLASLVRLWGKALGKSPPSPVQTEFRRHVDHFLNTYAIQIWGKQADPEKLKELFMAAARTK